MIYSDKWYNWYHEVFHLVHCIDSHYILFFNKATQQHPSNMSTLLLTHYTCEWVGLFVLNKSLLSQVVIKQRTTPVQTIKCCNINFDFEKQVHLNNGLYDYFYHHKRLVTVVQELHLGPKLLIPTGSDCYQHLLENSCHDDKGKRKHYQPAPICFMLLPDSLSVQTQSCVERLACVCLLF